MPPVSRRGALEAGGAACAAFLAPRSARAAGIGPLERTRLTLGLPLESTTFAGVYLAAERTFKEAGLDVTVLSFRGEAEETQALAGGTVNVSTQGIDGLIDLIEAGQPAIAFYGGFNQADFAWLAQPGVRDWNGLRGGTVGVSTYGSVTDQLTRYVLKQHGLEPEKDVRILQSGSPASSFAGFRAGRMTAAIESAPFKWMAQDIGFTMLGTQAQLVAPAWPKDCFVTTRGFLESNPNTLRAFLRAYVAAIRLGRANRELTIATLMQHLKYEQKYAERAYDEVMPAFDERGRLPERWMPTYWRVKVQSGAVAAPWPTTKFMDLRFVRTFDRWAA